MFKTLPRSGMHILTHLSIGKRTRMFRKQKNLLGLYYIAFLKVDVSLNQHA